MAGITVANIAVILWPIWVFGGLAMILECVLKADEDDRL